MKLPNITPGDTAHQSGQALAETAIVVVIVIMLLGGLIEFGWAYFRYLALQDAAGEGAAYGMIFPDHWQGDDPSAPQYNPDPNNITYRVRNESSSEILNWDAADIDVDATFTTPGNHLAVTVSYEHDLITPLMSPWFSDGTITLRARAVQTVLSPMATPTPDP